MKTIATALLLALFANGQNVPVVQQQAGPTTTADLLSAATTAAATTAAPVTTAAPGATNPAHPNPPAALPPLIPLDPGSFSCSGNTCMNRIIDVVPGSAWGFKCNGNCAGATINIDVGLDPLHPGQPVSYIDSITCGEPYSCVGVTVNIMNTNQGMGVVPVELNDLRCEKPYSCTGLIINAYQGVEIFNTNFDCQTDTSCMGCIVRDSMKLEACNQNQNPNGQLMMPWEVPGTGQMPQGPFRPAHQNPMLPHYTPKNPAPPMGLGGLPQNLPHLQPQQAPQPPAQQQPPYPYYPGSYNQPQQPAQQPPQYPYGGYYVPYPPQYPYGP